MKDHDLRRRLMDGAPGPDPDRKRAFLRSLPPAPVSHMRLLLDQAGYIRPLTWAASAGVFALAMALGRMFPANAVWAAAALTPFAAMIAAAESGRSALYGMEELELSARLGLKSVTLARMGVYILTPYLAADLLGLAAVRRLRGREGLYACAGAAALTAGLCAGLSGLRAYDPASFRWWLLALLLAAGCTGREYIKTIRKTEELSWSL